MTVELELDGSTRPPTSEERTSIDRVVAMMIATATGWNRLTWRPPLQGTSLVVKPGCSSCGKQGLPTLIPTPPPNEAGLRVHVERLGTHACRPA